MLSLLFRSALVLLALLIVALATVFLIDEKSTSTAVSACNVGGSSVRVRIIYHSVFARLLRWLTFGQLYAITIWHRVYVANDFLTPQNIQHELEHVRQWHEWGPVWFPIGYLLHLISDGYHANPFERWARAAAGQDPWLR